LCECVQEREAAYEREQKLIQIEKEKEVTRLRALQERARDEEAERDAIRARRAQEQAEREWRRKEAEDIQRQVETEAMLREAREQQMAQKEHFLAVEAQRERADFERVLRYWHRLVYWRSIRIQLCPICDKIFASLAVKWPRV